MMDRKIPGLVIGFILLSACTRATAIPPVATSTNPAAGQITTFPTASRTPLLVESPQSPKASSTVQANSSPSPIPPAAEEKVTAPVQPGFVSGYWVQNTQQDGLCSDSPRFIGLAPSGDKNLIGTNGQQVCWYDQVPLPQWARCGPDPFYDFVSWQSTSIEALEVVNASAVFLQLDCHYRPAVAGFGGRCIFSAGGGTFCQDSASGLPFDRIIGYGVDTRQVKWSPPNEDEYSNPKAAIDLEGVEWFLSDDRLASLQLEPADVDYSLQDLFGSNFKRATWLSVPDQAGESVWVGSKGAGLLQIDSKTGKPLELFQKELPGKTVYAIQSAGADCVWVGTDGGVGFWDGKEWRSYTTGNGLPGNQVFGVSTEKPTECKVVWAVTDAGPARLEIGSNRWQSFPDFPSTWRLNDTMLGEFATSGQGILRFIEAPVVSGTFHQYTDQDGLPDLQITALAQTTGGGILAGTPKGAVEWNGARWNQVITEPVNDVSSTMIATDNGLWLQREATWQKISNKPVMLVAEDGWFATAQQVCRWSEGKTFCPMTDQKTNLTGVTAMDVDAESGRLWVVDGKNEVWAYQRVPDGPGQFVSGNFAIVYGPMNALLATPNDLFFGNHKGLYLDSPFGETDSATWADNTLAGGWRVRVEDIRLAPENDSIWIATNQGIFRHPYILGEDHTGWLQPWTQTQPVTWTYLADLPTRDFTQVLPLPDGQLWLGTKDKGIIHVRIASIAP